MIQQPPPWVIAFVAARCSSCWPFLVRTANAVRTTDPVSLSSWYRDPQHNREVGGEARSQHTLGLALDLAGPGAREAGDQLRAMGWGRVIDEGDHVHAQLFRSNPF